MKAWFKYKYGYVNIDAEYLYFTNTGNWSDTKDLQERGIQKQNSFRQFRMYLIPFALSAVAVVIIFFMIFKVDPTIKYSSVIFIIALAYSSYKYLQPEIGETFKLPISKISNINLRQDSAIITFINGIEASSVYTLETLDDKGIELMEEIWSKIS